MLEGNIFNSHDLQISELDFGNQKDFQQVVDIYLNIPKSWNPAYKSSVENRSNLEKWMIENKPHLKCLIIKKDDFIKALHILLKSQQNKDTVCSIQTIWVDSQYRGHGWASELKKAGEQWAANQGAKKLITHVYVDNPLMLKINKKKGFLPIRLEMQKEL